MHREKGKDVSHPKCRIYLKEKTLSPSTVGAMRLNLVRNGAV